MFRRIVFGGVAAWFSRGVSIVIGLVLIPVLFRHLGRQELGVWLLLGQSWAVLGIFDFDFGVALTRRIAFAMGKSGSGLGGPMTGETLREVADLLATGRRVYRWLAFSAFVCSFGAGMFYLCSLDLRGMSVTTVWMAWGFLCLSQALGIWAAVWTCLMQGVGYIGWDAILSALVSSLTLLVQIASVLLGGGLVTLALAAALGSLTQRLLIVRFTRRRRGNLFSLKGRWRADLFRALVPPALRAWLTSVGYLLVAYTDQFFVAAYRGASAIPPYRAAFLLVINLHLLAGVFAGVSQVFVSYLWQAGDVGQIRAILRRNARIGLLAMACGGGALLALGPLLFDLWLGPGNFIGYPVLGIFLATFALEHHANVFSACGRATNDEAYALSSSISGILKIVFAFSLTAVLGLTGLALSTLLAQGLTNNWFMVYRSMNRLGVDFPQHIRQVLAPCLLVFVAALAVGCFADNCLDGCDSLCRVVVVSTVIGLLLAGSGWFLVFERVERARLVRRLGIGWAR